MRPDIARAILALAAGVDPDADQRQAEAIIFVFDGLHSDGRFDLSDRLIRAMRFDQVAEVVVVAVLTATKHAEVHLPSRPAMVEKCERRLVELVGPERATKLMENRR
jgi:hypothetical protein